jgi:putative transposase
MKKMVLNQTEYDSILLALKDTTSKRLSQRFYSVLYYLEGYKHYEIANLLKIDTHTVSLYIKKYKVGGINGLIERKYSPGTPRYLTSEQEERLVEVITEHTPDEVGFPPRKNWNLSIIREWIKRNFEVEYSQSGMADALHRLNLSYSRPTYTLKQADLEKQENFMNDFEIIKKNSLMKK